MSIDVDIQAYRMLTSEIEKLKQLPTPPDDLSHMEKFKEDINKVFQDASSTVVKVKEYADEVMNKIKEIRKVLKDYNSLIGKQIKDALEKLRAIAAASNSPSESSVENQTKSGPTPKPPYEAGLISLNNKLDRIKRSFQVSLPENKNLKALTNAHALEKIANELANNRLDDLTKETEKYMAKLQSGSQLTAADINELNGNCEAFLQKTKHSFDEQKRLQEEEKQRKENEEAEMLIKEEQERMRKEKEEQERKEKEEKEKIEAELRRRNDPNYWPYFVYDIEDNDSDIHGVCIFSCTDAKYTKDDIQCSVRDSQSLRNSLEPGETLASKQFHLLPKNGTMSLEVDARAYINHIASVQSGNEVCVKLLVNDGPWETFSSLDITNNIEIKDSSLQFAGVKLNNFRNARMVVVVRPESTQETVDQFGGVILSKNNENIKLHVPRKAFKESTSISLSSRHASIDQIATINSALKDNKVTSANHVITVSMNRPSDINLEVDLPTEETGSDSADSVIHRLVRTAGGNNWIPATVNDGSNNVSVTLPPGSDSFRVVEVSLPMRFSSDDAVTVADTVYDHTNRTAVMLLFYQKQNDPRRARLQCVEVARLREAIEMMTDEEYTYGCQQSNIFNLRDGQEMHVFISGNIARDSNEEGMLKMLYFNHLQHAIQDINLSVVNKRQQAGQAKYSGILTCHVMEPADKPSAELCTEYTVTLPVTLPKAKVAIGLPYYMKHLAVFLATELVTVDNFEWKEFVKSLTGEVKFNSLKQRADLIPSDKDKCDFILQNWMQESVELPMDDNSSPNERVIAVIMRQLKYFNLSYTEQRCQSFIHVMKEQISDDNLMKLVSGWSGDIFQTGKKLGLPKETIEKYTLGINEPHLQLFILLQLWRTSNGAFAVWTRVRNFLRSVLSQ